MSDITPTNSENQLTEKPETGQNSQSPQEDELTQKVTRIIQAVYSGPLPPPAAIERYNNVIPNGAERIMKMAEEQSEHRRGLESKVLKTDSRNSLMGIICAFILGMTTIIIGSIVVLNGQPWPGTLIGSAGLVGLVSAFIYGTRERRKERETKNKNNE